MKNERNGLKARIYTKRCRTAALLLTMAAIFTVPAYAAGDPIAAVNNLADLMYGLVRAIGTIVTLWGVVQVGISIPSHDPSQRSTGFLCVAGGLIFFFAKEILSLIIGS